MKIHIPGTDPPRFKKFGAHTPAKAWAEHVRWVKKQMTADPRKTAFLEMMLVRQRQDYEAGRFPWAWQEDPPATRAQLKKAIDEVVAEHPGIGRRRLIPLVLDKLDGYHVRRLQTIVDLAPKATAGRPRKKLAENREI